MTTVLIRYRPVKDNDGVTGTECLFYDTEVHNFFKSTHWEA